MCELDLNLPIARCRRTSLGLLMKPSAIPLSCFLINFRVCVQCVNITERGDVKFEKSSAAANVFSLSLRIQKRYSREKIHPGLSSAPRRRRGITHISLLDLSEGTLYSTCDFLMWICACSTSRPSCFTSPAMIHKNLHVIAVKEKRCVRVLYIRCSLPHQSE